MKRKYFIFLLSILLVSCSTTPSVSLNNSLDTSSSSASPSSDNPISENPSILQSASTSSVSNSTSASKPSIKQLTIKEARTLAEDLGDNEIGELIKIKATFLKVIKTTSSNLMYFADAESSIYLRVPVSKYTDYLDNRYTNYEYLITANIAKVDANIELQYNDDLDSRESVVNLSEEVSVNLNNITEAKESIISLVEDFENIRLDNKKCGTGKIVTFTGQLIATEYEDANKKAVFSDGTGVINVINDKKFVNREDVGKFYEITGIMNIKTTNPAILYLHNQYVIKSSTEESVINVNHSQTVEPDFLKSKYILSDKYYSPSIQEYLTLYQTKGFIVDNSKYNANANYHLGIAKENKASLISDSSSTGIKSVSGLFLINHYNISEKTFSYSPLFNYFLSSKEVSLYFTIDQFYSQDHGWKVFPIEKLIDPLETN